MTAPFLGFQKMTLAEQAFWRGHRFRGSYDATRPAGERYFHRLELEQPSALTLKTKHYESGHVEGVVMRTDLQRIINAATSEHKRTGKRKPHGQRDADDIERARIRARKSVRDFCIRINADRMATFTTRKTIEFDVLLTRFQRFARVYKKQTGEKWLYCAVPELHADGKHWHLHVATSGYFDLGVAQSIWWALCLNDDDAHDINGNINIKRFTVRKINDDIPSIVAGYIAKYVGKDLDTYFNRKAYWAARLSKMEVNHHILDSDKLEHAFNEVCAMLAIDSAQILLTHEGVFFPLGDNGFWFRITPDMRRLIPF